jgi:hypothetical protein
MNLSEQNGGHVRSLGCMFYASHKDDHNFSKVEHAQTLSHHSQKLTACGDISSHSPFQDHTRTDRNTNKRPRAKYCKRIAVSSKDADSVLQTL